MDSFIALDIETTGLNPLTDRMIEIAGVKFKNRKVEGWFSQFVQPGMPLPERITQLTGITEDMLQGAGEPAKVLGDFYEFLGDAVILGHNVLFDYSFLKRYYVNEKRDFQKTGIDTLGLSKRFHPELKSRSLSAMCEFYGIDNMHAHRAAGDAQAAACLYFKLRDRFGMGNEEVFCGSQLVCHIKKESPITRKQKNYLRDLLKYHKIEMNTVLNETVSLDSLTKSQASQCIDRIIFQYGRIL